ncbi:MAG: class I adenylate-forming enzyme family protein [Chloroflexota bacterium]
MTVPSPAANIYSVLQRHAQAFPEKILLATDDEVLSYGAFVAECEVLACALLALGTRPGQKIGLVLPNSGNWYKIFWAAVKIGAQPVPLDPQTGEWEMARLIGLAEIETCFVARRYRQNHILENILLAQCEAPLLKHIIVMDDDPETSGTFSLARFRALAAPPAEGTPHERSGKCVDAPGGVHPVGEDDALMLACTSGSTGNPKIIVVPHQGFYRSQLDMAAYLGFGPHDVMLLGMPLYHQGGFGMGLQMVLRGGSVFYLPAFEPVKFLKLIEQHKVTALQLTATLAKVLLSVPDFEQYDLSSVRMAYFAGEVLPMDLARVFFEKLKIRVVNVIGSTETATMVVWDSDTDIHVDVSNFRPLAFTKLKILDDALNEVADGEIGTIFIHTDALLYEYLKNERETALRIHWFEGEKWFNTGDLGEKYPGGRVRFAGRAKRIIKRGANLIYPEEIESFLLTHPDIEAVAVTGEKHELIGEMVVAHIQPRQGHTFTRGDLVRFCQGKLAAYKIPDQVVIVSEMPKDIGKVQFKYLRPG